jgi:hypothetical protein
MNVLDWLGYSVSIVLFKVLRRAGADKDRYMHTNCSESYWKHRRGKHTYHVPWACIFCIPKLFRFRA